MTDWLVVLTAITYAVGSFFGMIWILHHAGVIRIERR